MQESGGRLARNPFFLCWARWAETAGGSHPKSVRPQQEAVPAAGLPRSAGLRKAPGQVGVRSAPALGLFSRVEARVGCWPVAARVLGSQAGSQPTRCAHH